MKKLLLFLSFLSSAALADPWSGWTKITHLYPHSGGLTFLSEYANTDISSCDHGKRFQIHKSHPNYEMLSSILIAAFMGNKEVFFNIDSNQSKTCTPTINRFMVRD